MTIDSDDATIYQFPMGGKNLPTDEAGAIPIAPAEEAREVKDSGRAFLQAARRNLTEEEASSPAGIRWLTHDVERLDQECVALRREIQQFRQQCSSLMDQHHQKCIEVETLRAGSRLSVKNEILANLCLAAGSAGLGVMPSYFSTAEYLAIVGLVVSAVLFVGGLALRMWK
jgi:hypothetical protein